MRDLVYDIILAIGFIIAMYVILDAFGFIRYLDSLNI